jgi:hypothetical protein
VPVERILERQEMNQETNIYKIALKNLVKAYADAIYYDDAGVFISWRQEAFENALKLLDDSKIEQRVEKNRFLVED